MRVRFVAAGLVASALVLGSFAVPAQASAAPARPTAVKATASATTFTLTWKAAPANRSKVTKYQVGHRTWSSSRKAWTKYKVVTLSMSARSKSYKGTVGVVHQARVRARNAHGWGAWSAARSARIVAVPKAPTAVKATAGIGRVTVSWSDKNPTRSKASSYRVHSRSTSGTPSRWTTRTATSRSMVVTGLVPGKRYELYVTAVNGAGTSKRSATVAAVPLAPMPARIDTWPTAPLALAFGSYPATSFRIMTSGSARLPAIVEARRSPSTGPWTTTNGEMTSRGTAAIDLVVPGPGTWEVRLRTLATADTLATTSASRIVTMAPPVCSSTTTSRASGAERTQCELRVRPGSLQQDYVIQYAGAPTLSSLRPPALGIYFHGDGADPRTTSDGVNDWALARNAVVVDPISPLRTDSGSGPVPAWGNAQGIFHASLGLSTGRDLRALGTYFGVRESFYWAHSGGSRFLTEVYLPTGAALAPGPVALNCGGSAPMGPEGTDVLGPYGFLWSWLPGKQADVRARLPLQYDFGDQDYMASSIESSINEFRRLGFTTQRNVSAGVGHCGRDFSASNITWFEQHLAAL